MTAATASRIPALDILRGVAVLGILTMNIVGFAMPEPAYFNPAAYGGDSGVDLAAWAVNFILFDGKMRGLFSLLFGASMLLIIERAEAKGENPAAVHYRRILWLGLFGAIHFYLIWRGDILLHYALIALAAYGFKDLPLRQLGLAILFFLLLDLVIMSGLAATALELSSAGTGGWAELRATVAPPAPAALGADLALHRGGFLDLARQRFEESATLPFAFLAIGGPETLALMLIGMAGLRTGFLTGAWEAAAYRRVALGALLFGAAGFTLLALAMARADFDPAIVFAASWGGSVPFRIPMVIGYAALILLLARHGGALVDRFAAAGRMAFTNYLGTSLVMTGLFHGWGFGLYGRLGRAELWLVVLAMWVLMLLWSKPWLDRFRYGPFEWLWRSLARWQLQPMRILPGA